MFTAALWPVLFWSLTTQLMTSPGCAVPVTAPPGASADAAVLPVAASVPVLYTVDTAVVAALAFSAGTASGSAEDQQRPHPVPPRSQTPNHRTVTPVTQTYRPDARISRRQPCNRTPATQVENEATVPRGERIVVASAWSDY